MLYVGDFETTTDPDNCYVWAFATCEVNNHEAINNVNIGTSIDEFMSWCKSQKTNDTIYFHNLKFDGQFIIDWLFHNGFEHITESTDRATKTFTTLISDKGLWYQIEIIFYRQGKNINKVTIVDSLKLIPLSVDGIAKAFHLPIQKLNLDYGCHNGLPPGTPLTKHEKDYISHDVKIVAHAIDYFHHEGLTSMTIGSCALNEYKKIVHKFKFDKWFPTPKYHNDVVSSYKGGFTYLNPKFKGKTIKDGIVLDVNSLYPSVMYNDYLPFGTPIFYEGKYKKDELYPLYIQTIRCQFELKPNKIPTIQIKKSIFFRGNEYLSSSNGEQVPLCLTNVDLKLFLEHYDVYNLEYMSGWKFKATKGLFDEYIDKWSANKIKAKEEGNHGLYLISKLFLNSLYGKFGTSTMVKSKIPYLDEEDGKVHFYDSEVEERDGVYVALASFITSYARLKTISSAQQIQDDYHKGNSKAQFVYADTDSLHIYLNGETEESFFKRSPLDIDETRLGAWDHEMSFKKGKYLRQKCYIENEIISEEDYIKGTKPDDNGNLPDFHYLYNKDKEGYYKLKITVAGMPTGCYQHVTFNNFKIGASYSGKKQPKRVKGGIVLADVDFTIKEV